LTKKADSPEITESLVEFAKHVQSTYPAVSIILESEAASEIHERFTFPVFTSDKSNQRGFEDKVDLVSTFGGDGTILHAAALFSRSESVPPVLSFSMGTLGFLGEWRFDEYKKAFREVYMSGGSAGYGSTVLSSDGPESSTADNQKDSAEWASVRGYSMGSNRSARILLRNRLRAEVVSTTTLDKSPNTEHRPVYAMNEVIIHRGRTPHLVSMDVFVGGRFLTSAVADGMIVSTPTGSTAYSLSSGGSIVHPLVASLLLTPICPRSLSFRPLVLPLAHSNPISLRLSPRNRNNDVEVSIDGVRQEVGLTKGMEVRVWGEGVRDRNGVWKGGVPSVVRGGKDDGGEDHWVGGLNGLLKFNHPFGEG
jgi:NADH kinase